MIVTAWNPHGQQGSRGVNEKAQRRLTALIRERHATVPVMNGDGEWQEPALLVPAATLGDALGWAREFGQAAVVFGVGSRAALVWADGHIERFWAVRI